MTTIAARPMPRRAARPGLTKIRGLPLLLRRRLQLVSTLDGRWRDLLEAADVVSEGKARQEGGALVYYGSTSILFTSAAVDHDGPAPKPTVAELARVLAHDPHTRLRVVRVARNEAAARAGAPLGSVRAEVAVRVSDDGLVVTVDVVARVGKSERSVKRS